ncbi:hypothetical protein [Hymenobacter terrestris]|uniref:Uncharacterized protein n=1 Tax=Hymenobacter terrestris TaxID=2748310 RepID=A0ABX2Q8U4_9BACT|nr:hypothetical protein [Hymenobacter terrestris]NVO86700.1 hypothetical protein [Hymenobacter terrestris]
MPASLLWQSILVFLKRKPIPYTNLPKYWQVIHTKTLIHIPVNNSDLGMKTQPCQLFAYCETSGAPVGICALTEALAWRGTEHEQTLYWDVIEAIGQTLLFEFDNAHQFFNTETGNFALYQSTDGKELVVAEFISIELDVVIPWSGIAFSCNTDTRAPLNLKGLTCFFDAALTLPNGILPHVSLYAIAQVAPWNIAVLDCNYDTAYEVEFKSETMQIQGICFRKEHI